jgi:hypothetical protein
VAKGVKAKAAKITKESYATVLNIQSVVLVAEVKNGAVLNMLSVLLLAEVRNGAVLNAFDEETYTGEINASSSHFHRSTVDQVDII